METPQMKHKRHPSTFYLVTVFTDSKPTTYRYITRSTWNSARQGIRRLIREYAVWHAPTRITRAVVTPVRVVGQTTRTMKRITVDLDYTSGRKIATQTRNGTEVYFEPWFTLGKE